ncbi:ARM repeat superfamily protein [Forsythia ovata]|uniref:ARM repeat superfamily protein n=1 Tax=Forsythia ovata TaxID=205694 RepID=A0ABD1P4P3_9LAMI
MASCLVEKHTYIVFRTKNDAFMLVESDVNISAVIEKQGMDGLIELSSKFSNDSSVLQEIMSIISIRCLRAPKYATHASKSEAIVLVIQAIESFPDLDQLQRNSFS